MNSKYPDYDLNEPAIEVAHPVEQQAQPQSLFVTPVPPTRSNLIPGEVEVLKVSAKSRPSLVAGAIAGVVRQAGRVEIQSIGAGATNQAVKAVAIARGYLISSGIDIFFIPAFIDITINDEERTAIKLLIEKRTGFRPL